jgi:uncharacterized protein (TIGR03089 family)
MVAGSPTPAEVLAAMLAADPGRPRVTYYDDTPGPTQGERIELSAKVLANWVSKAANALQDEWDLGPGDTVRIALPPHWRSLYWALATWSVGATVALDPEHADLVVTDDPVTAEQEPPAVLVTLAALARGAQTAAAPEVFDEARQLATFPDQFVAYADPSPDDAALRLAGGTTAYADVVPETDWPQGVRVHTSGDELVEVLRAALAAWSRDGSIVLSRGPEPEGGRASRLAAEGVTLEL